MLGVLQHVLPCRSVEVHYSPMMKSTGCSETSKRFTRRHFQSFFCSATSKLGSRLPFFRFPDHTELYTRPVGLFRTSDQLVAGTATHSTHNKHKRQTLMGFDPSGFQPAIPAIKPLQISIMYNQQSKQNTIYAQSVHIFHNYMFRPILGHLQVVFLQPRERRRPKMGRNMQFWNICTLCA